MVEQVINPAAISGLLDPWIKEREQQQLGAGMGQAFQALQKEDYPGMAKALQGIAGQNPQVGIALMTAAHQQQQLRQQEALRKQELAQQERLRLLEIGKPTFTDMGMHTYDGSTGTLTMRPWSQDTQGNWVLGSPQIIDPRQVAAGPSQAAPAAGEPPPPSSAAAPAAVAPAPQGGWPAPSPTQVQKLKDNPDRRDEFDAKFGPGAADRIVPPAPAAAAPIPASAPAPPAQRGVIGSPIPGASPKGQMEAAARAGGKLQEEYARARDKAEVFKPKVEQIMRDWEELTKLGGIGKVWGGPIAQTAYAYGPFNTRIRELQGNLRQALLELGFNARPAQGQGAISNFERTLISGSLPSIDMANPATGTRYFENLMRALDTDITRGYRPVR